MTLEPFVIDDDETVLKAADLVRAGEGTVGYHAYGHDWEDTVYFIPNGWEYVSPPPPEPRWGRLILFLGCTIQINEARSVGNNDRFRYLAASEHDCWYVGLPEGADPRIVEDAFRRMQ